MHQCSLFIAQRDKARQETAAIRNSASQFARNASHTAATSSTAPGFDASLDWNADTGATSHMTPHRHFLRDYKPHRVPIQLADNKVVYSAGIGSFVFMPVVNGCNLQHLEFTNVLHVPELKNNLLSVLFLTRHRQYTVHITDKAMHFVQAGQERFTAVISDSDTAFLSGTTQCTPQQVFSAFAPAPHCLFLYPCGISALYTSAGTL